MGRFLVWMMVLGSMAVGITSAPADPISPEEHARRIARIQQIAAESGGKIEITLLPVKRSAPARQPDVQILEIPDGEGAPRSSPAFEGNFSSLFTTALQVFRTGEVQEALDRFDYLARISSNRKQHMTCLYWQGECLFQLCRYEHAMEVFRGVANEPDEAKADDAMVRLAMCALGLDRPSEARHWLQLLLHSFPDSEYRPAVQFWLSQWP
jgi:TolA-binding protein